MCGYCVVGFTYQCHALGCTDAVGVVDYFGSVGFRGTFCEDAACDVVDPAGLFADACGFGRGCQLAFLPLYASSTWCVSFSRNSSS